MKHKFNVSSFWYVALQSNLTFVSACYIPAARLEREKGWLQKQVAAGNIIFIAHNQLMQTFFTAPFSPDHDRTFFNQHYCQLQLAITGILEAS